MEFGLKAIHRPTGQVEIFPLQPGEYQLGRYTKQDPPTKLSVRNDGTLSRDHLTLRLRGDQLLVKRLKSRHPLEYQGRESEEFVLSLNQKFSSGQTTFEFTCQGSLPTANVEQRSLALAHSHLELRLSQGQREFRFPFFESEIDLEEVAGEAFPGGAPWTVRLRDDCVQLEHRPSGKVETLVVGQSLTIGNSRIWVSDAREPDLGTLEGLTGPYLGLVWHLRAQQAWVGRQGKRLNHIEINHPTISRVQATFSPKSQGVGLLAESATSPTTVNGDAVRCGEVVPLANGDLIGFADLFFRFTTRNDAPSANTRIFVTTLGTMRVNAFNEGGPEISISNQKASWLFALLATRWGEPLSIEPLIETFWPEVTVDRGRKNLSYTVSQLRQAFRAAELDLEDFLIRTRSELKLNPERLGAHDYTELSRLTNQRQALTSKTVLQRALKLYRGPFLSDCYEDWAEPLRRDLEQALVITLSATSAHLLHQEEYEGVELAASKALELDPFEETAVETLMNSALSQGTPRSALELYESFEKMLSRDGLEPPMELLKLYHRARLAI